MKKNGETEILRCSFCNKDQNDVRKLIAGPTVFICDECVEVCNDIIADDNRFENRGTAVLAADAPGDQEVPGRVRHRPGARPRRSWPSRSTTTTSASRSRSSRAAATTSS